MFEALRLGISEPSFWRSDMKRHTALVEASNRFNTHTEQPRKAKPADLAVFGISLPKAG